MIRDLTQCLYQVWTRQSLSNKKANHRLFRFDSVLLYSLCSSDINVSIDRNRTHRLNDTELLHCRLRPTTEGSEVGEIRRRLTGHTLTIRVPVPELGGNTVFFQFVGTMYNLFHLFKVTINFQLSSI